MQPRAADRDPLGAQQAAERGHGDARDDPGRPPARRQSGSSLAAGSGGRRSGSGMRGPCGPRSLRMASGDTKGPHAKISARSDRLSRAVDDSPLRLRRRPRGGRASAPCACTVARPRSAEDLIDEDDYARDERLPYWAELWPSAPRPGRARWTGPRPRRAAAWSSSAAGSAARDRGAAPAAARTYSPPTGTRTRSASPAPTPRRPARAWRRCSSTGTRRPPTPRRGPRADLVIGADLLYEERNGPALAAPAAPACCAPAARP